jgi:hypothetical protein
MTLRRVVGTSCVVMVSLGLIFLPPQFSGQDTKAQPQSGDNSPCRIAITDPPRQGTTVGAGSTVSGNASIPVGGHLWVLAHKSTLNGWWPQGGGETPVAAYGHWAVDVQYGVDTDRGNFEVAAIAVDNAGNNTLNAWVSTAATTGRYPSMVFPPVLQACPIARITVVKQ